MLSAFYFGVVCVTNQADDQDPKTNHRKCGWWDKNKAPWHDQFFKVPGHRNRGNQKYVVHSELPTPHKLGVPLIQSRAEHSGVALGFQRVLFRKVIVP